MNEEPSNVKRVEHSRSAAEPIGAPFGVDDRATGGPGVGQPTNRQGTAELSGSMTRMGGIEADPRHLPVDGQHPGADELVVHEDSVVVEPALSDRRREPGAE